MQWNHRRNQTKAEQKKNESKSGTKWSFIAAATVIA
ncbi:hypothetical protein SAMN05216278_3096 [Halopelagius longus]|uniref:Uncharacterized protein n=1 Tax=Halopelagius longus TaxID=1236180 RepID=A0A1H1EWC6_9EURY|nr:hypothetical protein SAMN05216278_3096 [Halopelagius longus]